MLLPEKLTFLNVCLSKIRVNKNNDIFICDLKMFNEIVVRTYWMTHLIKLLGFPEQFHKGLCLLHKCTWQWQMKTDLTLTAVVRAIAFVDIVLKIIWSRGHKFLIFCSILRHY